MIRFHFFAAIIFRIVVLSLVFSFPCFAEPYTAKPKANLDSCFKAAVKRSEAISDLDEQFLQSTEREKQAKGSLFPTLSASYTYFVQQSPSDPLTASFFPSTQPTAKITLSQPIFRGLREFAALRQFSRLSEAQSFERDQALMHLHADVAQVFFNLLAQEHELENLQTQMKLYKDRVEELRRRIRTGQSMSSEALTAKASAAVIQAQIKQLNGQIESTREAFAFLTGLSSKTFLIYSEQEIPPGKTLAEYLANIPYRPDVLSAQRKIDAADEAVLSAKGAHFPTVDFLGNYYFQRPEGVFKDLKWDFQLSLNIPIFSGGIIQSQVRESLSKRTQAELNLSRTQREADQEIRSLFKNYRSNVEQAEALKEAMTLSEENYQVLKADYSRGLTRNIDVLQALTQFQESKRAFDRISWNLKSDRTRLAIIASDLTHKTDFQGLNSSGQSSTRK